MRAPVPMRALARLAALAVGLPLAGAARAPRLWHRRAVIGGGIAATVPTAVHASRYGEAARLGLVTEENDAVARNALGSQTGPALYRGAFDAMDEAERAQLLVKEEAIDKRWRKMVTAVSKALSASTPAYPAAQAALDGGMNTLKTDMRTVSKALSGGDITVRDATLGGVDQPRFDYNTGQFELQPIPQQAEAVFGVVNELYFAGIKAKAPPDNALSSVAKADRLFEQWLAMVQQAQSTRP